MNSIYYFAARTDSGFLLGCDHEHQTVTEAVACILCAGGYVIAVEHSVLRALTDDEEAEFQRAPHLASSSKVQELEYEASGYAVMVRVRFVDGWDWDTWMRFDTYKRLRTQETAIGSCLLGPSSGLHCARAVNANAI
jgi:hypothetical protein